MLLDLLIYVLFRQKRTRTYFSRADAVINENHKNNRLLIDLLIQLHIVKNTGTYLMKVLPTALDVKQANLLINTA